jgi:hypothetical protein
MRSNRRFSVGMALVLALASMLVLAGGATAGGRPISVGLTGAAEAPGPGDPDGSGMVSLTFNPGTGQVCYDFSVTGVAALTAAHIHVAPAGSPGPVVIPLPPTTATGGSGCVTAARDLIVAILKNPAAYYFNVHNADYPAGALRGQLTR